MTSTRLDPAAHLSDAPVRGQHCGRCGKAAIGGLARWAATVVAAVLGVGSLLRVRRVGAPHRRQLDGSSEAASGGRAG